MAKYMIEIDTPDEDAFAIARIVGTLQGAFPDAKVVSVEGVYDGQE